MKLLEYMESELALWEQRLDGGEKPGFAELSRLQRTGRKIYAQMVKNGFMEKA